MQPNESADTIKPKDRAAAFLAECNLSIVSTFVPFSQSRSKGQKDPCLNWKISVRKDGREILSTDYSAGCAHCPSYTQDLGTGKSAQYKRSIRARLIAKECETGLAQWFSEARDTVMPHGSKRVIEPEAVDVFYSLIMDSDVLCSGGFEDWASNFGYDTDSRKAEGIYRACLEIALKLQAALGPKLMDEAREAFEGY